MRRENDFKQIERVFDQRFGNKMAVDVVASTFFLISFHILWHAIVSINTFYFHSLG